MTIDTIAAEPRKGYSWSELVAYALLTVCTFVFYGFTFWLLWGWFMVPLGLPSISVGHATGLHAILRFAVASRSKNRDPLSASLYGEAAIWPLVCLAVGFVAKQFM
jgi:hypothetical protein